jgi:hypothetical protein
MALLSYLMSHWAIVLGVIFLATALSIGSWFFKNIKFLAAAAAVLAVGLAYQAVDMEGYKRRVNEEARDKIETLQQRLDVLAAIAKGYRDHYAADEQELATLKDQARDTPANSGACLPLDATRRVRAIRSGKQPSKPR